MLQNQLSYPVDSSAGSSFHQCMCICQFIINLTHYFFSRLSCCIWVVYLLQFFYQFLFLVLLTQCVIRPVKWSSYLSESTLLSPALYLPFNLLLCLLTLYNLLTPPDSSFSKLVVSSHDFLLSIGLGSWLWVWKDLFLSLVISAFLYIMLSLLGHSRHKRLSQLFWKIYGRFK